MSAVATIENWIRDHFNGFTVGLFVIGAIIVATQFGVIDMGRDDEGQTTLDQLRAECYAEAYARRNPYVGDC